MVRGARLLVFLLLIGGGRCQSTNEDKSVTTTESQSTSEDTSIATTEGQSTSEDTSVTNSGGKSIYDFWFIINITIQNILRQSLNQSDSLNRLLT